MKFIDELNALLATADSSMASDSDFPDIDPSKDHVVGVCDDQVRAIMGRIQSLSEKADDYKAYVTGENCEKHPSFPKWRGEDYIIRRKIENLDALMWICLHEAFPMLIDKSGTAIRKGWKVVWFEQKRQECPRCSVKVISVGIGGPTMPSSSAGKN